MTPNPRFGATWIHEGHVYETLRSVAPSATEEADQVILEAFHAAAPELSPSKTKVLLDTRRAEQAFETILSTVEDTLKQLCARHDYRQFLHVSRLCSAVPELMREDKNHEDRRVRTLSADRWILRCAPRSLSQDYMTMSGNDYHLQAVSDALCRDAAKLHVLAHFHQREVEERVRFNFARLVSARNGLRGPTLRMHEDTTIGWDLPKELLDSVVLFFMRYQHYNEALAWWGMGDADTGNEYFALSADPNPALHETGQPFVPQAVSLDAWLEYGRRFRVLFERDIGMPPEHFWAISRALGSLGLESAVADGGRLQRWVGCTATIPVRREDLLGGCLARLAADELQGLGALVNGRQDLERSVARFVQLASSTAGTPALRAEWAADGVVPEDENPGASTSRSTYYPYMIHGTDEHDYWIVDYLMTVPFIRGIVNELAFSASSSTTSFGESDTFVRTSVFDAHLARALAEIPGYEVTFKAHRTDPDLPNATFYFNEGAESRELDVPLRLGEVLVAVQTWTPAVNAKTMAGKRRAMERRWNNARNKLRDTDRKYTDYLLRTEAGRRHMLDEGLKYILPIVCGPYTEPLVSLNQEFWMRYPQFTGSLEGPEGAVPRVLTPRELMTFLEDATEQELRTICEQRSWAL